MTGVDVRLGQLFDPATHRAFVVAFDHGQSLPLSPSLGNPVRILEKIGEGNPDGVLINPGMLEQASHVFARRGAPVPIVRADWTPLDLGMKNEMGETRVPLITPERALTLGAGAICLFLIGRPLAQDMYYRNVEGVSATISAAHSCGLPVIVECTLWGLRNDNQKDPALLAQVCRTAAEIGADIVKTEYVGDIAAQRRIIATVGDIPVLTLGGAKGGDEEVADNARDAIAAGAQGLIFGRNVWQSDDMAGRMKLFGEITHSDTK